MFTETELYTFIVNSNMSQIGKQTRVDLCASFTVVIIIIIIIVINVTLLDQMSLDTKMQMNMNSVVWHHLFQWSVTCYSVSSCSALPSVFFPILVTPALRLFHSLSSPRSLFHLRLPSSLRFLLVRKKPCYIAKKQIKMII